MSALPVAPTRLCEGCGASVPRDDLYIILGRPYCPLCVNTQQLRLLAYKPERRETGK